MSREDERRAAERARVRNTGRTLPEAEAEAAALAEQVRESGTEGTQTQG